MKILLSDFDGTLVNRDILDVLCGINGKEAESIFLNEEFIAGRREGLPILKQRIDFLIGVGKEQIKAKLDQNDFLVKGAVDLFKFLKSNHVITVLHSGNIMPVLEYYQRKLGIDYLVGNMPRCKGDVIQGIELEDFASRDFKFTGCQNIINKLGVIKDDIVAIGDSPADLQVFGLAGTKVVINAKGGIEKEADLILKDDLSDLIPILRKRFSLYA